MESHLLEILVCPLCKSSLQYDRSAQELICKADKLAFPVRDGIPVMLENEARTLSAVQPPSAPSQAPDIPGPAPDEQTQSPGSP